MGPGQKKSKYPTTFLLGSCWDNLWIIAQHGSENLDEARQGWKQWVAILFCYWPFALSMSLLCIHTRLISIEMICSKRKKFKKKYSPFSTLILSVQVKIDFFALIKSFLTVFSRLDANLPHDIFSFWQRPVCEQIVGLCFSCEVSINVNTFNFVTISLTITSKVSKT